jgi:hypothetical protein
MQQEKEITASRFHFFSFISSNSNLEEEERMKL